MTKTVTWDSVKQKRPYDEERVSRLSKAMAAEERACALREIRQEQGITQQELARRMDLSQPTISALESGHLDRSALATIRSYIEALGGRIRVTATFGRSEVSLI